MSAVDKAEKLVNNYRVMLMQTDTDAGEEILCTSIAKECAMIAVDEIRDNIPLISEIKDYWTEVKNEIIKL
jgi:hypothetical protein